MKILDKLKKLLMPSVRDRDLAALEKEYGSQSAPLRLDIDAELEKQRLKHIHYIGRQSF